MQRLVLAVAVVVACSLGGCTCGRQSDEEILRERIDTTSVHLYLATKIAVLKADQSPAAKAARDELLRALAALQGKPVPGSTTGAREHTAQDYLTLARALWELRQEGQELLASGDEKGLAPVLPSLLGQDAEVAKFIDLPTEHALLLAGGFVAKFHPKTPVPLPVEILLYEAWMTHTAELVLPGLAPLAAALKASVYGTNELCDLAKQEADWAESHRAAPADLASSLSKLASTNVGIDAEEAAQLNTAVRALAHGSTGLCYLGRDQQEEAVAELEQLVTAAHEMGVPRGETAMIRAYVAYQKEDYAGAEKALVEARDYPGTPVESKKEIEGLIDHVRQRNDGKIATSFGKGYFAAAAFGMILRRLDEAGVFDELRRSELWQTIDGYVSAAGKAVDALPSTDGMKDQGQKLLDRVTK